MIPQRDYLSGGAWNIENEIQQLRSKTIELTKPNEPISLEAPKPEGWFLCLMFLYDSTLSTPVSKMYAMFNCKHSVISLQLLVKYKKKISDNNKL